MELDQEIKTSLQINIANYREKQGKFYFTIILAKLHNTEQHRIERRYSEFSSLHEKLKKYSYQLPKFP